MVLVISTALLVCSMPVTKPLSCTSPLKPWTAISQDFRVESLNMAVLTFAVRMLLSTHCPSLPLASEAVQEVKEIKTKAKK